MDLCAQVFGERLQMASAPHSKFAGDIRAPSTHLAALATLERRPVCLRAAALRCTHREHDHSCELRARDTRYVHPSAQASLAEQNRDSCADTGDDERHHQDKCDELGVHGLRR